MKKQFLISVLLFSSCGDKSAHLVVPPTMALGSYADTGLTDSCSGIGKIGTSGPCSPEGEVSNEYFISDHPEIIEVIDSSTAPASLGLFQNKVLHAVGPGRATLRSRSKFSDGTVREASATVEVYAITEVTLKSSNCLGPPPYYVPFGHEIFIGLDVRAGTRDLDGTFEDPLSCKTLAGSPPTTSNDCTATDPYPPMVVDPPEYSWTAPTTPTTISVTSRLDPAWSTTIASVGPLQITGVRVESLELCHSSYQPGNSYFGTQPMVNGHDTCGSVPVMVRFETPDVCTMADGKTEGTAASDSFQYKARKEGLCRVSLGGSGASYVSQAEWREFIVRPPAQGEEVTVTACTQDGLRACSGDRSATLLCSHGEWKRTTCPADQVCDYIPAGVAPCSGRSDCPVCRGLQ
jgi:hypothetical protein